MVLRMGWMIEQDQSFVLINSVSKHAPTIWRITLINLRYLTCSQLHHICRLCDPASVPQLLCFTCFNRLFIVFCRDIRPSQQFQT